jgi:HEAT repeat protein
MNTLKDPDPTVRSNAAKALGQMENSRALEALISALRDTDASVRLSAAEALGVIEKNTSPKMDPRVVGPLAEALSDPDVRVRQKAAWALIGDADKAMRVIPVREYVKEVFSPRALSALLEVMTKRDSAVIAGNITFFLEIGEPGSEDALMEALKKSGNQEMATLFLNCGNSKLEEAGSAWATAHNLNVRKVPARVGNSGGVWGGRK